jgi:hypothetical protein
MSKSEAIILSFKDFADRMQKTRQIGIMDEPTACECGSKTYVIIEQGVYCEFCNDRKGVV